MLWISSLISAKCRLGWRHFWQHFYQIFVSISYPSNNCQVAECKSVLRLTAIQSWCYQAARIVIWWQEFERVCFYALCRDNMWSSCPLGYFLNGFYRNDGKKLQNIKKGNCCKPSSHPESYGMCYDEDVKTKFERKGWTYCSKRSYYITGIYRGSGNKLKNIDLFRCCQMASGKNL